MPSRELGLFYGYDHVIDGKNNPIYPEDGLTISEYLQDHQIPILQQRNVAVNDYLRASGFELAGRLNSICRPESWVYFTGMIMLSIEKNNPVCPEDGLTISEHLQDSQNSQISVYSNETLL